jgi:hypothetical protein
VRSYKERKGNAMESPTLNKNFSSSMRPSSYKEKEETKLDGGDRSLQKASVKSPSLSNSNKSFNLLFNIGMLQNISDESISLTYTHTEQSSSETSDSNECFHQVTCLNETENVSSGNSVSSTSYPKSNVSLQRFHKNNSSERERKEHELLNFTVTSKQEGM